MADTTSVGLLDLWLEGEWRRRDPVRPWWQGTWVGARLRASHEESGSTFATVELDARRYWPVTDTASESVRPPVS